MSKLRLDRFLNMGYKLSIGDCVTKLTGGVTRINSNNLTTYNKVDQYGIDRRFVHSFVCGDVSDLINTINAEVSIGKAKPRTKVEYVKCEKSSIFNLCEMFELKELHFDANCDESKKLPVETERHLTQLFFSDSPIYRKVEAEITWQDEVNSCIYDIRSSDGTRLLKYQITAIKEAIKENPYAVLSLCHLVASMTDKPE